MIIEGNFPDDFIIPDVKGHSVYAPMKNNSCENCGTDCPFGEDTKNGLIKGGICPDWDSEIKRK